MKCPLCGKNFLQPLDCKHDEYDLIDHIGMLESDIRALAGKMTLECVNGGREWCRCSTCEYAEELLALVEKDDDK